jgi:hypothetical protein
MNCCALIASLGLVSSTAGCAAGDVAPEYAVPVKPSRGYIQCNPCPPPRDSTTATQRVLVNFSSATAMVGDEPEVAPTGFLPRDGARPVVAGVPLASTASFTVQVDSAGTPATSRTVTFTVAAVDLAGLGIDSSFGHYHSCAGGCTKPAGSLSTISVGTAAGTSSAVVFTASVESTPVTLVAKSAGADSAVIHLVVAIPSLIHLAVSSHENVLGRTDSHPSNHWLIPKMDTLLKVLADSMAASPGGHNLYINDISLEKGGRFDFLYHKFGTPHAEHMLGRDADIRTDSNKVGGWNQTHLARIVEIWENRLHGVVHDETKHPNGTPIPSDSGPHYHLRYRGTP